MIVTPEGPRLIDYGIARLITEPVSAINAGSPGWLAPERYAGAPPEPASDVFAWGCLAYFAATGEVWTFLGFPTYGGGPFERWGVSTSVALLGASSWCVPPSCCWA